MRRNVQPTSGSLQRFGDNIIKSGNKVYEKIVSERLY